MNLEDLQDKPKAEEAATDFTEDDNDGIKVKVSAQQEGRPTHFALLDKL